MQRPQQGAWLQQRSRWGRQTRGPRAAASEGMSSEESLVKADVGVPSESQPMADAAPESPTVRPQHVSVPPDSAVGA